ncbi:MAG: hypothetical protein RL143_45, partial [Pseudomonadota bacterium]
VGEVVEHDAAAGKLVIDVKNKFEVGDTLELMTPVGNRRFKLGELYDKKGASIEVAPGSGHRVTLPLDFATDMEYALLMRDLPNAPERG